MKVIIAGGRDFDNFELLKSRLDFLLGSTEESVEIVSGRCSTGTFTFKTDDGTKVYGADGLGEKYAQEKGYKVTAFPADWSLGKKAGIMRNKEMSVYADAAVIFWDGKSRGSKNMAENAQRDGLKLRIVRY